MKRVFNVSGGKSSFMAALVSNPTEEDIFLFDDTGREHPKTYKFIDDFEVHEGFKIHRATYMREDTGELYGFASYNQHKTYLPNRVKRICTEELKINVTRKYLRSLGITHRSAPFEQFIGYRADEPDRVKRYKPTWKNAIPRFPLYEMGINKAMVNEFWANKPYNLEIPSILGNCDLCFLKGKNTIIRILQHFPEMADKWIADEERIAKKRPDNPSTYFPDVTYRQLLQAAQSQISLFPEEDLSLLTPAFNCSCHA